MSNVDVVRMSSSRIVVKIGPSWLGRLFGARPRWIEIDRQPGGVWRATGAPRDLGQLADYVHGWQPDPVVEPEPPQAETGYRDLYVESRPRGGCSGGGK